MKIITACNAQYYGRITAYLDSLRAHSQIPATLVTVGFQATYPGITCAYLPRFQNEGAPIESELPQHGAWLQVVSGEPGDVVIFTDGDITLQRPFSHQELDALADLPDGAVMAGYNSGPAETLAIEGGRLFPRFGLDQIGLRFRLELEHTPCFNIGVIAARRSTWEAIYDAYMPLWKLATDAFAHPARQQWLVCAVMAILGLDVRVTPYSFHANGHYGIPPGVSVDGAAYYNGEMVAFRHRL
jgi:hypothetical protein